jgi:hypothetical protein
MNSHLILSLFHLFVVAPLFFYVGFERTAVPDAVFTLFLVLGSIITLYHGYKAYIRFMTSSPYLWVNLIHVVLIGPLLVYIGYMAKNTTTPFYEMLLLLAFGATGYHIYSLVYQMNNVDKFT